MEKLIEHTRRIKNKLQLLLKQYQFLEKENTRLSDTVKKLIQQKEMDDRHLDSYYQEISLLKASLGKLNEKDKKEFEKRINLYLKDIDKCIELLSEV